MIFTNLISGDLAKTHSKIPTLERGNR